MKELFLHYTATGNGAQILQYLLQTEQKIDTRNMYGRTPLSWAAEYGLERRVNTDAINYEVGTPLAGADLHAQGWPAGDGDRL